MRSGINCAIDTIACPIQLVPHVDNCVTLGSCYHPYRGDSFKILILSERKPSALNPYPATLTYRQLFTSRLEFLMGAINMNPDQSAPKGALFTIYAT